MIGDWWKKHALERIQISDEEWRQAEAQLPFLGHLDADERSRLRQMVRQFLAEKEWDGAGGLHLTASIQLSIALQASLLVLNLGLEHYRGWVGIVVYPGDFIVPRHVMDANGVVHEYDDPVLGEAWEGGPVLLSWFDEAAQAQGINNVIHEFAHKLDMENGKTDGMPRLPDDMSRQDWLAAFGSAYKDFCRRVDAADRRGEETELDAYGSEHPSEFFAVVSEAFFETPRVLLREYPEVYEQLRRFYRQDPLRQEE